MANTCIWLIGKEALSRLSREREGGGEGERGGERGRNIHQNSLDVQGNNWKDPRRQSATSSHSRLHIYFNFYTWSTCSHRVLFSLVKLEPHIISNQRKRSPLRHFGKAVFSHPLHGLMKGFTGTFSFNKVFVEPSYQLFFCWVWNGPHRNQYRASTGSQ